MPIGILKLVPALSDLLTASMLANSLEIVRRLSAIPFVDGNDHHHAEFQPQWIVAASPFVAQCIRKGSN